MNRLTQQRSSTAAPARGHQLLACRRLQRAPAKPTRCQSRSRPRHPCCSGSAQYSALTAGMPCDAGPLDCRGRAKSCGCWTRVAQRWRLAARSLAVAQPAPQSSLPQQRRRQSLSREPQRCGAPDAMQSPRAGPRRQHAPPPQSAGLGQTRAAWQLPYVVTETAAMANVAVAAGNRVNGAAARRASVVVM